MILRKKQPLRSFQKEIIGLNKKVPLVSGKYARYINLDNAASTPVGTGVLIGPTATFARGAPDYAGGGTIETVSLEDI
ncbi:hypothetical protein H0A61_00017 [Koleobacter methoxysyntrophicus]|uniref:Uncharacterized protein n=1 Tax=Koleobacter methoxysyntrophicus TaxID=2751313 RepID=A0A8A0RGV1_9FIRM|nr:hypothetical protein [Koleobacter methoxysyntrophicus]QSQ07701.1 hypothetical protein H0A61_00017 [Koleobacter methoxysyntrophicus]